MPHFGVLAGLPKFIVRNLFEEAVSVQQYKKGLYSASHYQWSDFRSNYFFSNYDVEESVTKLDNGT